jgi:hypothetical protein
MVDVGKIIRDELAKRRPVHGGYPPVHVDCERRCRPSLRGRTGYVTVDELANPDVLDRLRALRLWHWRAALFWRSEAVKFRDIRAALLSESAAMEYDRRADDHIKAVQVLNDLFPSGDTAEHDNTNPFVASAGHAPRFMAAETP